MNTPYRILKLRSGEEIIARIRGEKQGKLILERPMIFKSIMVSSPHGTQKEITVLKNWLSFTDAIETKIPKDFIATYLEPDNTVVELYDMEKEKEDVNPPEPKKIIDAKDIDKKNKNMKLPPMPGELNDIMKKLTDEDIRNMFDMVEQEIQEHPDMFEEVPQLPFAEDEGEHMISLSMFLPPEALLSLVEAGLLDIEDVQKLIETLSNPPQIPYGKFGPWFKDKKNDGKNGKYTGDDEDRKSADDYGKRWEDWSPDPNDYL